MISENLVVIVSCTYFVYLILMYVVYLLELKLVCIYAYYIGLNVGFENIHVSLVLESLIVIAAIVNVNIISRSVNCRC